MLSWCTKTRARRRDEFKRINETVCHIDANALYNQLFNKIDPKPHFVGRDKEHLLSLAGSQYTRPRNLGSDFSSCLIVPVTPEEGGAALTMPDEPSRNPPAYGLVCVDSEHEYVFDDDYDLEIMKQISLSVYSAMRNMNAVVTMLEITKK